MLSSPPVIHPDRVGRRAIVCVLAAALVSVVHGQPQDPVRPAWREVLRDLAAKVAASLSRSEPFDLSVAAPGIPAGFDPHSMETEAAAILTARNLRPAPRAETNTHVLVGCAESMQGRLCAAEISRGGTTTVHFAVRPPLNEGGAAEPRALAALTVQPLFAQQSPILDVAELDPQRILVLDVDAVTLFERTAPGWTRKDAKPLERTASWPRDVRGRLVVLGNKIEAYLPGRSCHGTVDPFELACPDGRTPWPLGIENDGLADGRNFFTSPKVPPFYSIALVSQSGETAWLLAAVDGGLRLVDSRSRTVGSFAGRGEDVVRISGECTTDRPVVLIGQDSPDGDGASVRAFEFGNGFPAPLATPASLPGDLLALWPARDGSAALAVVHDLGLTQYEAYLVRVSCTR
jgi:hypothetical protein